MTLEPPERSVNPYEAAALEAAFAEMVKEECSELTAQEPSAEEAQTLDALEQRLPVQLARLDKMIDRHNRLAPRQQVQQFLRAAAILAIVFLGFGTAVAAHEPLRIRFLEYLTQSTNEYLAMGFKKSTQALAVPDDWQGSFFPSYLPDGFELAYYQSDARRSSAVFNATDCSVTLNIYTASSMTRVNSEHAETRPIQIGNAEALLVSLDGLHTIILSGEANYVSISSTSQDAAIAFAESLSPLIPEYFILP